MSDIIKHGDPKKIKWIKEHWSVQHTCRHCGCVFATRDGEKHPRTEYDADYVACPDCGMRAK